MKLNLYLFFYFVLSFSFYNQLCAQDNSKNKIAAQKIYDKAIIELDNKSFSRGIGLLERKSIPEIVNHDPVHHQPDWAPHMRGFRGCCRRWGAGDRDRVILR